ncbi:MAG: biotin--[acetyl-CoA-carboxylase] ligase [Acidobacteria bacterium]|nr:MAG: biotin--[acetyl-CoA-carboxylase] ligase [Acidobacteriota bacterium]
MALAAADKGRSAHGTVVVAEEQTAGRGRFGRTWYSEKSSGIYSSVIMRPPLSPASAPALTLMAGVAAHAAISSTTGLSVDIRWPNDLLINGKKVCGILTEMNAELDRLHSVVLGIGINVNHREMPPELGAIATSLRIETGKVYARAQVLVSLLPRSSSGGPPDQPTPRGSGFACLRIRASSWPRRWASSQAGPSRSAGTTAAKSPWLRAK